MMITPQFTIKRRYGFSKACSAALGSSEYPKAFYSYENLNGDVTPVADTVTDVRIFSSTGHASLYAKTSDAVQSSFEDVAGTLYWVDGAVALKYTGPNLLKYSSTFDNVAWTSGDVTLTGGQADPDGGTKAYSASFSTTNGFVAQGHAPAYIPAASNTFTSSIYLRVSSGTATIAIQISDNVSVNTTLIVTLTTSWQRFSVSGTLGVGSTQAWLYVNGPSNTGLTYYLYKSQLEVGATATTPQITTNLPQGVSKMGIATPVTTPTVTPGSGSLSPSVGFKWVYVYKNSATGTTSSASPASANPGSGTSQEYTIGGDASTDPQVDKIDIYRTKDGGGIYYFDAEITNPGSGTFSYTDNNADSTLNTDLIAPLAGVNNPPPAGATLLFWYAGRLWAVVGNTVYYSAGPDCTNGVGTEAWPAANNFAVQGNITAAAPSSQGLILFTRDDAYVITGTSSATFADPLLWQVNWGVANENCISQDQDSFYAITTKGQVFSYANGSFDEIGFANQADFGAMTPANCYIAFHRSGGDEGVFVSDGSANIWRYSTVSNSWDTSYAIAGGCHAIGSIELTDNQWHLMMGRDSGSGYILERDTTTYADDGTTYTASATFGSLTVAPPRQVMKTQSILAQVSRQGTYPTVSVMLNEIAVSSGTATFTALPNPVPDPPQLPQAISMWSTRHDLKAATSALPQYVQHLQIKFDFISENAANELLGFGVV